VPAGPVDLERLCLATGAVESDHELFTEPLAERMLGNELAQLGDDFGLAAESEIGVEPILEHGQAELLEAVGVDTDERLVGQISERRSAPEPQSLPKAIRRGPRVAFAEQPPSLACQLREAVGVELPGRDPERVARRP
jgi:hypothetical protein